MSSKPSEMGACSNSVMSVTDPVQPPREFLCGVVEGFYGRPWTTEQRKDLFTKMQLWGMNSYLYAPKDDCKHRAYWREQYTVEEADHLQSLINLANECNIDFFYAISPGLDVVYSNTKEVATLKRKLDQVAQLGCKAFALLFDDIEPEMCKQDKEVFQSFAQAQVSVTNEIFEHLGHPKFLFCPTQYCTARAVPSVRNSEYLQTIGTKLAPEIKVMWTGDKVISKVISRTSLEDITEVLKRPLVIWDNEHANDYDQKRVFLGPYSGRSPDIIQKLGGVMTNPNCEYGANFIAVHTLAQWSRCTVDGTMPNSNDAISSDIKLEIQSGEDGSSEDLVTASLPPHVYHPKNALLKAINDWIPEFSRQKTVWGPMSKPQVGLSQPSILPTISTCLTTNSLVNVGAPLSQISVTGSITAPLSSLGSVPPIPPNMAQGIGISSSAAAPDTIPPVTASTAAAAAVAVATNVLGASTSQPQTPLGSEQGISGIPQAVGLQVASILQPPIALPLMNSLVSTNKVVVDHAPIDPPCSDSTMSPAAAAATVLGSGGGPVAAAAAAATVLSSGGGPLTMSAAIAAAANVVSSANSIGIVQQGLHQTGAPPTPGCVPAGLQRVIPAVLGNSCLEPMDCLPTPANTSVNSDDDKIEDSEIDNSKNNDINMESCTNPPTPASAMQVESDSNLHKTESTTMLCDLVETEISRSGPPPLASKSAFGGDEQEFTSMVCDDPQMSASPMASNFDDSLEISNPLNIRVGDGNKHITVKDLLMLVQLFYLPNEHGQIGLDLLNDFFWLKRNATAMLPTGSAGSGSKEDKSEWERRAFKFQSRVAEIVRLFLKLCACDNRELVYDLYTYLWDMCCVIQLLEGFIQWLSKGVVSPKCQNYVMGQQTWFSGVREAFQSGDHEPWVFRGGLVSDLVRLLPLDSGSDLYLYKHPDVPASLLYLVRPYQPKDEADIYRLVASAYEEQIDAPMGLCRSDRELIGDHAVGAYITLSPEFCFVCESSLDGSIVGYVVASQDSKIFHTRYQMAWLPEMRTKYPRKQVDITANEDVMLTPIEEIAQSFHSDKEIKLPPCVYSTQSNGDSTIILPCGIAKVRLAASVTGDFSIAKRLIMLVFSSMRAAGTTRLYVEVPRCDVKMREFYSTLGFLPLGVTNPMLPGAATSAAPPAPAPIDDDNEIIFMTRIF